MLAHLIADALRDGSVIAETAGGYSLVAIAAGEPGRLLADRAATSSGGGGVRGAGTH